MENTEAFFNQLNRMYRLELVEKIRLGVIVAAASPSSYTVQWPGGEQTAKVPRVSAVVPQIDDLVRVSLVGDQPVIVDVLNRRRIKETTITSAGASTSSATFVVGGVGTDSITLDLIDGQTVLVTVTAKMSHTLDAGHGAVMSYRVTGATTFGPNDDDGIEQDNVGGATCSRTTIFTATGTGAHTFTLMYRAINGATANFSQRQLLIVE